MDLREVLRMKASPTLWAEVESLRELKDTREMERNMAEEAAASFKERAEAAEAKLAEVQKDRDGLFEQRTRLRQENKSLRASMDRARELAERGVAIWDVTDSGKYFASIARLLSGDEKS